MKRVLVMYGTSEGHTAKICAVVASTLRAADCLVDLCDVKRNKERVPDVYDAVVVAASVHAQGYQRPLCTWVRRNAPALNRRPTVFLSVCLGVLEHNPKTDLHLQEILNTFMAEQGWSASVTKIVAGALPYTRYGWLKKRIMRRIVAKVGGDVDTTRDYEYTDWNDLRAFVQAFARQHGLVLEQESVR